MPSTPATASEPRKASRISGSPIPAESSATRDARREAIEAREPGAVGDPDAAERNRGRGEGRSHDSRPRRRRAFVTVERSKLLEQHLGREVVALAAHEADDCGEWLREISGEREALSRERADASGSADRDTFRLESAAEERGRRERGLRRGSSSKPAPRDDERGERRRLPDVEARLPARPGSSSVEPRLIADHRTVDPRDPPGRHLGCERVEIGCSERRIAEAPQEQIAVPHVADERAGADDLGVEAVARAEEGQGGIRHRQLLVRRGLQRAPGVPGEDHGAAAQVDRERSRSATDRPAAPRAPSRALPAGSGRSHARAPRAGARRRPARTRGMGRGRLEDGANGPCPDVEADP